jgi:hypothetical protein
MLQKGTADLSTHLHHHRHDPGTAHPSASVSPSILRLSAYERLVAAALMSALLWGAVYWAIA